MGYVLAAEPEAEAAKKQREQRPPLSWCSKRHQSGHGASETMETPARRTPNEKETKTNNHRDRY